MAQNKLQWKIIAKGNILPCQSFLRKKDGEILKLSTTGGVKVGQDCYYLPVDEVINVIKDYPIEGGELTGKDIDTIALEHVKKCKAFTSLEQSRKLAKFLPLESADMYYFDDNGEEPNFKVRNGITYYYDSEDFLCCWSLAALLGVLPEGTRLLKSTNISSIGDVKYHIECPKGNIDKWFDNPVDACVAMIEKLHELKKL